MSVVFFFLLGFRWRFGPVILSQLFTILQLLIKTNSSLKLFLTTGKIYIWKLKPVFSLHLFITLQKHPSLLLQQSPARALRAPCQACDIYCLLSPSSWSEVIRWEPRLAVQKKWCNFALDHRVGERNGKTWAECTVKGPNIRKAGKKENPTCIIIFKA